MRSRLRVAEPRSCRASQYGGEREGRTIGFRQPARRRHRRCACTRSPTVSSVALASASAPVLAGEGPPTVSGMGSAIGDHPPRRQPRERHRWSRQERSGPCGSSWAGAYSIGVVRSNGTASASTAPRPKEVRRLVPRAALRWQLPSAAATERCALTEIGLDLPEWEARAVRFPPSSLRNGATVTGAGIDPESGHDDVRNPEFAAGGKARRQYVRLPHAYQAFPSRDVAGALARLHATSASRKESSSTPSGRYPVTTAYGRSVPALLGAMFPLHRRSNTECYVGNVLLD